MSIGNVSGSCIAQVSGVGFGVWGLGFGVWGLSLVPLLGGGGGGLGLKFRV